MWCLFKKGPKKFTSKPFKRISSWNRKWQYKTEYISKVLSGCRADKSWKIPKGNLINTFLNDNDLASIQMSTFKERTKEDRRSKIWSLRANRRQSIRNQKRDEYTSEDLELIVKILSCNKWLHSQFLNWRWTYLALLKLIHLCINI
jgi:hypothetical protein